MINGERSILAHKGMPLKLAANSGRTCPGTAPWLSTFSARPSSTLDRMVGERFIDTPEGDASKDEQSNVNGDSPSTKQNGMTGENFAAPHAFSNSANAGSSLTANTKDAESQGWAEAKAAVSGASSGTTPSANKRLRPDAALASPRQDSLSPHRNDVDAVVSGGQPERRHVFVQEIVRESVPHQTDGMDVARTTATYVTEMPMQYIGAPSAGESKPSDRSFTGPRPWQIEGDIWHVESPAGLPAVAALETPTASGQSRANRISGQQELLDRLGQQEVSPRRVHIGNLHITVQRPGAATGAHAALPPQNSASHVTESQTFTNPWEKHWTVFD